MEQKDTLHPEVQRYHRQRITQLVAKLYDCRTLEQAEGYIDKLEPYAEMGYEQAQAVIGVHYLGIGNYKKSLRWTKLAAQQGHLEAKGVLAYHYYLGLGTAKDKKKAFELFKFAADNGLPDAMCNTALSYLHGYGCEKDGELAFAYLKMAVDNEYVPSFWLMGLLFHYGVGVTKPNIANALYWYDKALSTEGGDEVVMKIWLLKRQLCRLCSKK